MLQLTQRTQSLLGHPIVVDVAVVGCASLDYLLGRSTLALAGAAQQVLLSDDQQEHDNASQENVQEECLAVQALIDLGDQHSLVEDGFVVLDAIGVTVGQCDVQTEGTAGKLIGGQESVRDGRLKARLHLTVVCHSREVLNEVVEVHGVAERCLHGLNDELLLALVRESNKELNRFASGQIQLLTANMQGLCE